jgi:hypothetical protein
MYGNNVLEFYCDMNNTKMILIGLRGSNAGNVRTIHA